jgi:glycosyltransferase involved in cell wall biosynthesis
MKRISSVFRAALGYEVIHFNFGTTMAMPSLPLSKSGASLSLRFVRELHFLFSELLQILEVRLLILLRRRVVITFQGDDARQGDVSRAIFDESIALHVQSDYYNSRTDRIKRRRIRRLSNLTNSIYYVNPDLAHFLPATAKFIPYCHIDVDGKAPSTKNRKTNRVHIVHAPSHQAAKGTDVIVENLKKMKDDGHPIEFTLLEDIPHTELGDFLLGVDLLIDQLYAGWYGGIAVEALCRGVPVMTFLRHADFSAIPEQMAEDLPMIAVNSADLSEALSRFLALEDRELNELQSCGIRYAAKWHDPKKVATEYAQHYFSRI